MVQIEALVQVAIGCNHVWAMPKQIEFATVLAPFYSSASKFRSAIFRSAQ